MRLGKLNSADLEKLPLLGVHPHGLDRGDIEETRVEILEVVIDEITPENREAAWSVPVLVVMCVNIESVRRYFGVLAGPLVHHHIPELRGGRDISGKTASWREAKINMGFIMARQEDKSHPFQQRQLARAAHRVAFRNSQGS